MATTRVQTPGPCPPSSAKSSSCAAISAEKEIRPRGREVDEADIVTPVDIFAQGRARSGITDFMIPEEFGGGGFTDVFTQCLVQEELCWGDPGIGNLVCSNGFFSDPIMVLGTEEQKKRWLTPLTGPKPSMTVAGHHRTRVRVRRRVDHHHRHPGRRRVPDQRAEGVDLQRGRRRPLRGVRQDRSDQALRRGVGLPAAARAPRE